ncbi:cytochrome c551 [Bacillus sp. AFS002410]|uniref:cytochrome c551 n=1 Tax=Bacillus sp. AFS002410 TaxID=2033481 RepID=UPI00211D26E7|nr:cytochrome c [Bacillus sp. AFS002410]
MKKLLLAFVTGGMLLTMAACGSNNNNNTSDTKDSSEPASVANGEKFFKQTCASCHGGNLEGIIGPSLKKVGAKYSEKDIENIIHDGRGSMPSGVLKGNEAKSVAMWLATKK